MDVDARQVDLVGMELAGLQQFFDFSDADLTGTGYLCEVNAERGGGGKESEKGRQSKN